ncbi:MAG: DoxX family protein [Anaerolineaceae bacterium]|jgi:hypothetical protein
MNLILWIVQIILAIKFLSVVFSHGFRQGQDKMRQGIQKMGTATPLLLAIIATILFLGGAGLILPGALGFLTWLVPCAAALLAVMMLASIPLHLRCREDAKVFVSIILFALCALVAIGRWLILPL